MRSCGLRRFACLVSSVCDGVLCVVLFVVVCVDCVVVGLCVVCGVFVFVVCVRCVVCGVVILCLWCWVVRCVCVSLGLFCLRGVASCCVGVYCSVCAL